MTFEPFDPNATQPVPPPAAPPQAAAPVPAFEPVAPEPMPVPVPVAQPAVRSSGGSGRMLNIALGVAVLIAAAGIAFAAGRMTAPTTAASTNQFSGVLNGNGGFRGNGGYFPDGNGGFAPGAGNGNGNGGGRFDLGGGLSITGTVDSVTADSVTIKTQSGQLITIGTDGTTTYHQQAPASASDVQAGKTVIVQLSGGFRPGANGNGGNGGNGAAGTITLGPAGSITVVP